MCQIALSKSTNKVKIYSSASSDSNEKNHTTFLQKKLFNLFFPSTFRKCNLRHLTTYVMFSVQRFAILAMFCGEVARFYLVERLHDFYFAERLRDFFVVERLCGFFVLRGCIFFVWRGCVIFWCCGCVLFLQRGWMFFFGEVAWFKEIKVVCFFLHGEVAWFFSITHSLRLHDYFWR